MVPVTVSLDASSPESSCAAATAGPTQGLDAAPLVVELMLQPWSFQQRLQLQGADLATRPHARTRHRSEEEGRDDRWVQVRWQRNRQALHVHVRAPLPLPTQTHMVMHKVY